jgi:hypothetical protein
VVTAHGGALAGNSAAASRRQGSTGDLEGSTGGGGPGKEEGVGVHRSDGPMVRRCKRHRAAVFNGGEVAPVVVNECRGVLLLEGDQGVRRQRSIEEWSSSEGTHRKGADGGDARTESDAEEGLRWREPARRTPGRWGKRVRRSGVDERDERRGGGATERGGGPTAGTPRGVGPGSDQRAASRPRPGQSRLARAARLCFDSGAPTWLTRGPQLVAGD